MKPVCGWLIDWCFQYVVLTIVVVQISKSVTYVNEESKKFDLQVQSEQGGLEIIQSTLVTHSSLNIFSNFLFY